MHEALSQHFQSQFSLHFEAEIDMVSHKISQMLKISVTSVVHYNRGIHHTRYDYYSTMVSMVTMVTMMLMFMIS